MRSDTKVTLSILGVLVLGMAAYTFFSARPQVAPAPAPAPAVERAQDGTYTTLEGDTFTLEPAANQLTVVVSWATWCPECAAELGKAVALSERFSTSTLSVIAMNRAEPAFRIEQYLNARSPEVLQSSVAVIADPDDHLFASISGYTVPETILLNADGSILHHVRGPMDVEQMSQWIETNLPQV